RLRAEGAGVGEGRPLVEDGQHVGVRRVHRHAGFQMKRAAGRRARSLAAIAAALGAAAALAFIAAMALAPPLSAQNTIRGAARCTMPDTTKEWFKQQRAWLDDSRPEWSNASLRQVLLRAT